MIPVSLGGGITGGFIASKLSGDKMYIIAIILLIFAFITSFKGKKHFSGTEPLRMNRVSIPGLFGIGMYDGLFGPGQGTLMLYLFGYMNIAYIRAVALARLASFSNLSVRQKRSRSPPSSLVKEKLLRPSRPNSPITNSLKHSPIKSECLFTFPFDCPLI